MKTEKENDAALARRNAELRERLQKALRDNHSLREEATRQHERADQEQEALRRTHDTAVILYQDAMRVLEEHDARPVYNELEAERAAHRKLQEKLRRWKLFARQAVETKSLLTRTVSELGNVIEEMRQRTAAAEESAQRAASHAQALINQRNAQLTRIAGWTGQWHKGTIGALETVTGILAELDGFPLPGTEMLERRRASRHAQTQSMLNEALAELDAIGCLLEAEGVPQVSTRLQQVRSYLRLKEATDTGKGDPHR